MTNRKQVSTVIAVFVAAVLILSALFVNTSFSGFSGVRGAKAGNVAASVEAAAEEENVQMPSYYTIFRFISDYVPFKESGKAIEE